MGFPCPRQEVPRGGKECVTTASWDLPWIGEKYRSKFGPRVLIEDAGKSYHAAQRVNENASPPLSTLSC